jgi:acyl carrier protein
MSFREDLLTFVRDEIVADGSGASIDENEPLIERGLIDSIALLKITTYIEERTGLRVPDDEVTPDNFQSVADIDQLVARLRAR